MWTRALRLHADCKLQQPGLAEVGCPCLLAGHVIMLLVRAVQSSS